MIDKITLVRDILYKCFIVGFFFTLVNVAVYKINPSMFISVLRFYYNIEDSNATLMVGYYFILIRIILLYFALIPGLALHWTILELKKKQRKQEIEAAA
jgi:hypothetical protein